MFDDEIFSQKEELIKSKKYIITLLSNKYYFQKAKLCLIRQQYLNKYENSISNYDQNKDNNELNFWFDIQDSIDLEFKALLNILNAPNIKLNELPKIFPLNEYNYKYFKKSIGHKAIKNKYVTNIDNNIKTEEIELISGIFAQGLLKIKINEFLYLFFFEEDDFLRQGYLQIKNTNLSENIIFDLETNGPRYFVKNINGNNINDKESYVETETYNLYILSKFDISIEKIRNEFDKINNEKNFKLMSKSMKLPPNKFSLSLKIEDFVKDMEEKIEKNVSNINSIFDSTISIKRMKSVENNNNKFSRTYSFKNNKKKKEEELNNNNTNEKNNEDNLKYTQLMINNNKDNFKSIQSIFYLEKTDIQKEEDIPEENPPEMPTGLVGLSNIGATCYMNATLQSFSSVGFLVNELLIPEFYEKLEKNKESKMRLTFALAEVFKNLWENSNDKKDYPPEYFKNVISDMNPLFKGIAANDPKDLILFMLETMHSELKTIDPNIIVDNNFIPNEHIFEEVYKDFSNYYLSKNKSIIFDIFFGCTTIITCCLDMKCRSQTYNVQVNNIVFFPLEEVRKFKNKNHETPVTIYDCFDFNQRHDIYESYYCSGCSNNNSTVISFSKYLYTPKVLIINLNRGKGIQFNVKFNFEEFIEIKNYVCGKDSPHSYELIAVICHYGESGMGGHFIAFCKHLVNYEYKWFKFNDSFVTESNFNEVKTSGMPYVLFYSYIY